MRHVNPKITLMSKTKVRIQISLLLTACFYLIACGSVDTKQPTQSHQSTPTAIKASPPNGTTSQNESSRIAMTPGISASLFGWMTGMNQPGVATDFDFVHIPPHAPVSISPNSKSSLDKMRDTRFWGYALKHKSTGQHLPIYGEINASGYLVNQSEPSNLTYKGYFRLHNFNIVKLKEVTSKQLIRNFSIVGFYGYRSVSGAQTINHQLVFSNLVANTYRCQWKYSFWDSDKNGWGINPERMLTFHALVGFQQKTAQSQWTLYTNLPRSFLSDLEPPSIEIARNLFQTITEFPKVQRYRTLSFNDKFFECKYTTVNGGRNLGRNQHRYALFYPRFNYLSKFAPTKETFKYTRPRHKIYNFTYSTVGAALSKALLLSHYEKHLELNGKKEKALAYFNTFSEDVLYALDAKDQLELWVVGGSHSQTKRLLNTQNKPVYYRIPMALHALEKITQQGYLQKCDDNSYLMAGRCDASTYPTIKRNKSGEIFDVFNGENNSFAYAWNAGKKRMETTPIANNIAKASQQRSTFVCQQLSENLASIDRRLQRPFISQRPYSRWYETEVSRYLAAARRGEEIDGRFSPNTVAKRIDDQERQGLKTLGELLAQAKRAASLASPEVCPDTALLAQEYVPEVDALRREILKLITPISKDMFAQAADLTTMMYRAAKAKRSAEHEAWKKRFWADSMQSLQKTMDISSTVNQITQQTNQTYAKALAIQEARNKQLMQKRTTQKPVALSNTTKPQSVKPSLQPVKQVKQTPSKSPTQAHTQPKQSFNLTTTGALSLSTGKMVGASSPAPSNSQTESIKQQTKPQKRPLIESLSYCRQFKNKDTWACNGIIQNTLIGDKLDISLKQSGCRSPRKWVAFKEGRLYFCKEKLLDRNINSGKITWNRDISKWIDIPRSLLDQRVEYPE